MSHNVSDGSVSRLTPKWDDAHPWLISAAVILSLGARNAKWLTLSDVLAVLVQALFAVTVGFLVLLALRRSARHAAFIASWFSLLLFYYGVLFDELTSIAPGANGILRHGVLIAIGLGVPAIMWHLTGDLKRLARFMSLTSGITLTVFSAKFGATLAQEPRLPSTRASTSSITSSTVVPANSSHPDVYYLILDGYGRSDVLQSYYDFDNGEFLDGLSRRGFYVADKSTTNYTATAFSLSSSLNMEYLATLPPEGGFKPLAKMVRSHEVGRLFRELGYRLVHFNTRFIATSCSDIAHTSLGEPEWMPAGSSMLMLHLLRHSAWRFVDGGDRGIYASQHLRALNQLAEVPQLPGPKFTFCHLVAPHPPFVFHRDGKTDWEINQDSRDAYIDQLVYLNCEVTRVIDAILANSAVPPIIIVQSDHGPGFCSSKNNSDPDWDYVQERIPILNAFLVPEPMRKTLYPTMTPVNTFRLLLSTCFGQSFPPLPDRNFVTHRVNWPEFSEITDQVHDGTPDQSVRRPKSSPKNPMVAGKQSTSAN